jgi:hypothetical protein
MTRSESAKRGEKVFMFMSKVHVEGRFLADEINPSNGICPASNPKGISNSLRSTALSLSA